VVAPFAEGITYPVLIDREHVLTELLAISNVPTVLWVDEQDRIVRPNTVAFGTDTFIDFTGVSRVPHMDAIRRWVRTGEVGPVEPDAVGDLDDDEIQARLEYRVALHLLRTDRADAAAAHFAAADALAPDDFTIRRAAMPLTGRDPFGEEFFTLYQQWEANGSPYHGTRPSRS